MALLCILSDIFIFTPKHCSRAKSTDTCESQSETTEREKSKANTTKQFPVLCFPRIRMVSHLFFIKTRQLTYFQLDFRVKSGICSTHWLWATLAKVMESFTPQSKHLTRSDHSYLLAEMLVSCECHVFWLWLKIIGQVYLSQYLSISANLYFKWSLASETHFQMTKLEKLYLLF